MKSYFDDIQNDVETFRKTISAAIQAAKNAQAENNSRDLSEFKDPDRIRGDREKEILRGLSSSVVKARADLASSVRYSAFQIRQDLQQDGIKMPETVTQQKALSRLDLFQRYGIPMTTEDAQSIAADLAGNALALRGLAAVADRSGIVVELPKAQDAEKVLSAFEKACTSACFSEFISPEFNKAISGERKTTGEILDAYAVEPGHQQNRETVDSSRTGAWLAAAQAAEFSASFASLRQLGDSLQKGGSVRIYEKAQDTAAQPQASQNR